MIARSKRWWLPAISVAVFATAGVFSTTAIAEDYTTNTIAGVILDIDGNVVVGATITLESKKGVRRSSTVGSDGTFRMPQLPIGAYTATVSADGFDTLAGQAIYNRLGEGGKYTFTILPTGTIEEIVTIGHRQASIDFESNTSGITVDVSELQLKYPVPRTLTDIALFAPGTHLGEQDFNTRANGRLASFSGGSVAENAYYINGMNVTNFRNFTGGSTIPFEFFDQVEVKTGGYQAEFGRSMGGFVNAVSKSGGNDFHFEITNYWTPEGGRETRNDVDTVWNSLDYDKDTQMIIQASGPIIQDRVFLYALYNDRDRFEQDFSTSRKVITRDADPFYAVKLDIIPFDGHRLEYTYFTDERKIVQDNFAFNDVGGDREDVDGSEVGTFIGQGFTLAGGENHIVKYTAVINDNFSISAMYGQNEFFRTTQSTADANPVIFERISGTSSTTIGAWANVFASSGKDEREAVRIDADFYFSAYGDHHIRVGFDEEDLTSDDLSSLSGGEYWRFNFCRDAVGCFGNTVAPGEEWVRHLIIDQGGSFKTKQSAVYIQDSWQATDRLLVNVGLRSENFENLNSLGEVFIKTDDEIAPRIGVTYDLRGDGRTLISGFFGRYYMPIAANTNIRLSGAELFTEGFYRHNGFDQRTSGIDTPTGVDFANPISFDLVSDGEIPDVAIIKAEQVDPLFNDEFILGFEHAFDNEWVIGARYVSRKLTTQVDDIGINHAIVAWALDNGYALDDVWPIIDSSQTSIEYVLANPGEGITVSTDLLDPLDGSTGLVRMNLTKEQLEYPKVKREYTSLEFTASKETEKWGVNASYVWSQNEGNTEGGVKSDNGQDDAGLTQDFDLVALGLNAEGALPTEVEHQLKASGYYVVNDEFRLGGNLRIRAPRKFGCFGVLPDGIYGTAANAFDAGGNFTGDLAALRQRYESQYDDDYWFCFGETTPRASQMESDWTYTFDLSATYTPRLDDLIGKLTFRVDVFNVFNDQGITDIFERGEQVGGTAIDNFSTPSGYNAPRKIRVSVNWRF